MLQPTPAFDKPLTEAEKAFATMTDKPGYDVLVRRLNQLMEERMADLIEKVWGWPHHRGTRVNSRRSLENGHGKSD